MARSSPVVPLRLLTAKEKARVYVPPSIAPSERDAFLAELQEVLRSYLRPLENGVPREDMVEYLTDPQLARLSLLEFLRYRRFVSTADDLLHLAFKYSRSPAPVKGRHVRLVELRVEVATFESIEQLERSVAKRVEELLTLSWEALPDKTGLRWLDVDPCRHSVSRWPEMGSVIHLSHTPDDSGGGET